MVLAPEDLRGGSIPGIGRCADRRRRRALALAALLGLSACASVSSTPVSTETVDNSYRLYSIQWQDTDVVTGVAVKLRPAGDGTLICGAFAATGSDFERREIEQQ
ncbi:MAG: hypothetical protein AAFX50_22375, partial [Acidobacteriota bacterium]